MAHGHRADEKKWQLDIVRAGYACLEAPVAEGYENEIITISNPTYLTRETIQHLIDNFLFVLVFVTNKGSKLTCACLIFSSVPTPAQLKSHKFEVTHHQ